MLEARIDGKIVGTHPPTAVAPLVLSDTVDIDFGVAAPFDHTRFARAFIPYQSGTLRLVFPDGSTFDKVVVADTKYVIVVRRFNATGTSGVTTGEIQN